MKSVSALSVQFTHITINDMDAIFCDERIDGDTIPNGLHKYELRHGDGGIPRTIEETVIANFYGTILTKEIFVIDDYIDIYDIRYHNDQPITAFQFA